MKLPVACLFSACLTTAALGQSRILWNESVDGPLSINYTAPTLLGSLQLGTNQVIGITELLPNGTGGWLGLYDYFTYSILPTHSLTGAFLNTDNQRLLVGVSDSTYSSLFGYVDNPINGDLLPMMGLPSISEGYYGMFLESQDRQAYPTVINYRLDFVIQTIPEPGALALLLLGATGCFLQNRWRKSS